MNGKADQTQGAWYVVRTKPKQEFRALEHLRNQGYICFLPTLEMQKITGDRRRNSVVPLFSRYMFIQLESLTINWAPIKSTRGVSNMLKFGERFAVVPDDCMQSLRQPSTFVHEKFFEQGDRVTVASGPFAGIEGIYQASDGEARALILIEILSKPQQLVFAMEQLKSAA